MYTAPTKKQSRLYLNYGIHTHTQQQYKNVAADEILENYIHFDVYKCTCVCVLISMISCLINISKENVENEKKAPKHTHTHTRREQRWQIIIRM